MNEGRLAIKWGKCTINCAPPHKILCICEWSRNNEPKVDNVRRFQWWGSGSNIMQLVKNMMSVYTVKDRHSFDTILPNQSPQAPFFYQIPKWSGRSQSWSSHYKCIYLFELTRFVLITPRTRKINLIGILIAVYYCSMSMHLFVMFKSPACRMVWGLLLKSVYRYL